MNDLTETPDTLQARLAAQAAITDTRDALLRTAMALPSNLQYLAEGGGFASMITDLVRAIADATGSPRTGRPSVTCAAATRTRPDGTPSARRRRGARSPT